MFTDKRSKKVILLAHCILNQNAKIDGCAHYPGAIREATQLLLEAGVGLIQLPCPELLYLGLDREVIRDSRATIESEDTRVARRMAEDKSRRLCLTIIDNLIFQLEEYQKNGFEVIGLVGINGSPTCGVNTTWAEDREPQGPGIFISLLNEELIKRGIAIPMAGIKARDPIDTVATIKLILSGEYH